MILMLQTVFDTYEITFSRPGWNPRDCIVGFVSDTPNKHYIEGPTNIGRKEVKDSWGLPIFITTKGFDDPAYGNSGSWPAILFDCGLLVVGSEPIWLTDGGYHVTIREVNYAPVRI